MLSGLKHNIEHSSKSRITLIYVKDVIMPPSKCQGTHSHDLCFSCSLKHDFVLFLKWLEEKYFLRNVSNVSMVCRIFVIRNFIIFCYRRLKKNEIAHQRHSTKGWRLPIIQ